MARPFFLGNLRNLRHALPLTVALLAIALASLARVPTVAYADTITLQQVASGLSSPVGLVNAGDSSGRMFIVEQTGQIKIFDGNSVLVDEFLDVGPLISCCGERGLLGLAFHPDYEANGQFYIDYTDDSGAIVVAQYEVSATDDNIADPDPVAEIISEPRPAGNHNGGQLAFGPDGYLYVGMGDSGGGGDPGEAAENITSLLGKIWRLDIDAAAPHIPVINPFVGEAGRDEIWAYGLRNPWRFSFDRFTGDLFIADVGQGSREEIDFQPASADQTVALNYGWDIMEGSACHEPSSGCNTAGKVLPIIEYDHSNGDCSVTGGYRYRGDASQLYGTYIYGDYCSGRVWGATFNGTGWTRQELMNAPHNISSFGEDEHGEIYLVSYGGSLHRIIANDDFDADGRAAVNDNCPSVANAGQQDADADALGDACEATAYGTSASIADSDGDGCDDGVEARNLNFSPTQGGGRNPADPWDFFDLDASGDIDLADTLDVLMFFGDPGITPAANLRDRRLPDPAKPWRTAEADDGVDLQDALRSLASFGHACA